MSKNQSSYLKYRACYLSIGVILLMFTLFFALRTLIPPTETVRIKVVESSPVAHCVLESSSTQLTRPATFRNLTPPVFDSESYYRTIIDNNLFRPLGWTPPRPQEPYRLIGTLIPTNSDTPLKAFLLATATNKIHIVTTGEKLDSETTVTVIETKQVTLSTNGQQRTLKLNTATWLNTSYANRYPSRRQTPVPMRQQTLVRRKPIPAATLVPPKPTDTPPRRGLSEWQAPDDRPIPIGDARLKNPEKWRLRRR